MTNDAGDVVLGLTGVAALLYGLFLSLAVVFDRAGIDAVALGIGFVLVVQAVQSLRSIGR